ncbi:MAG: hypothetical protein C0501_07310 [Isosphaera sp.]|nr:hypothetical protein [Isosphaera sp.]
MGQTDDRGDYPWWVRVSLFGSRTRSRVMSYFWMSLIFCPVCLGIGLWLLAESPVFKVSAWMFLAAGVLFVPAALLYWFSVRWVDRNGRWPAAGR